MAKVTKEAAARVLRMAARYEATEPDCVPLARACYDLGLTLRSIEPYTDWRTDECLTLARRLHDWRRLDHPSAMAWNDRLTNLARIAGELLDEEVTP